MIVAGVLLVSTTVLAMTGVDQMSQINALKKALEESEAREREMRVALMMKKEQD
jgi:hypothetical protein